MPKAPMISRKKASDKIDEVYNRHTKIIEKQGLFKDNPSLRSAMSNLKSLIKAEIELLWQMIMIIH